MIDQTENVGWLDAGTAFPTARPSESMLELLWNFCMISVRPSRGLHPCPFCAPALVNVVERNGSRVVLGSAEIRVFVPNGTSAFAAPNLIYHYVSVHHYVPPEAFIEALKAGPQPNTPEYEQLLNVAQLRWRTTPALDDEEANFVAFKAVKNGDKVEFVGFPKS
jgi:hypothetical protein